MCNNYAVALNSNWGQGRVSKDLQMVIHQLQDQCSLNILKCTWEDGHEPSTRTAAALMVKILPQYCRMGSARDLIQRWARTVMCSLVKVLEYYHTFIVLYFLLNGRNLVIGSSYHLIAGREKQIDFSGVLKAKRHPDRFVKLWKV